MADPAGEWKFRLAAAYRETEALRFELAAREAAALEAKLADAEAEIRRLRAKVNALLQLLAEPEPPQ